MTGVPVTVAALNVQSDEVQLPFQELVPLLDRLTFTLTSDATVTMVAFAEGTRVNDAQAFLTLDGDVALLEGDLIDRPSYTRLLSAGTHTVDYTTFAFGPNVVVGYRGVIVTDLTTGT